MRFRLEQANTNLASALAELHTAVAGDLTRQFGTGPWSSKTSEKGVLLAMRTSRVFVAREGSRVVGTLRLTAKKPWAIDRSYFTDRECPLYLVSKAIIPSRQREGPSRKCLQAVRHIAHAWPADAIRLDAYDAPAGAGRFYARCGFTEVGRATYRKTPLVYYELLTGPTK